MDNLEWADPVSMFLFVTLSLEGNVEVVVGS